LSPELKFLIASSYLVSSAQSNFRRVSASLLLRASTVDFRYFLGPAAIQELKNASGFCRDQCFGLIGQVSAMAGDWPAALVAMRQLQRRDYASPWQVATIYAQLNDKERAFEWLDKAYDGREHDLVFANAWPLFDNLRSDPRYAQLLQRIGLPRHD
jgi:hypothetical protein